MERTPPPDRSPRQPRAIFTLVTLGLLAAVFAGCTPKVEPRKVSFMSLIQGDSFSETIPYSAGTESQYTFDNTKIELQGGVARLMGADQIDDDGTSSGFSSTDAMGLSVYGPLSTVSGAQGLKLGLQGGCDGHTADCGGMNTLSPNWAPQFSSLIGYWTMDGTLTTLSNGNSIAGAVGPSLTVTGSGSSRANGKVGQAFSSGGSAYLFKNAPLSSQTTNVSFGAWVYMTASVANALILGNGDSGSNGYQILIGDGFGGLGNKVTLLLGGVSFNALASSPSLPQNTWTHLLVTRDTSTWTLYVNGAVATTGTQNPTLPATMFSIGNNFPGLIDDVGFWNTALTANQVASIYQSQASGTSGYYHSRVINSGSNSSPWTALKWAPNLPLAKALPDSSGTTAQNETTATYPALTTATLMTGISALWHLDEAAGTSGAGSIADASGQNHPMTAANAVFGASGVFSRAAVLNGNNSTLNVTTASPLLSTISTFSVWVRIHSRGNADGSPIFAHTGALYFGVEGSSGVLEFWDGGSWRRAPSGVVTLHQWHHVALVQSGTSTALYLDGVQVYSGAFVPGTPSNTLEIGHRSDAPGSPFVVDGELDEIAIWSRSLAPAEIEQLYARGSSRMRFQVRSCMTFNCSDATWKGPDGTANTYFTEEFNRATQAASPTGATLASVPSMTLANFTSPPANNRYFQYRVVLGSRSAAAQLQPELKSVEIGPSRFANTQPTIQSKAPITYNKLKDLAETLGAGGCPGGIRYSVSADGVFWLYYNGTGWDVADGTFARANTAAELKQSFSFLTTLSHSSVYLRAHFNSNGSQACELDQIVISGER